jgi:lysozyme
MEISERGLDLIKRFEGLSIKAYQCSAGVWSIGFGSTSNVKPGQIITVAEAHHRLKQDVRDSEAAVKRLVTVPLSQHQFDALVSFVFNVGAGALSKSTLLKKLNAGDYQGAAGEFLRWNKAGGKVLPGLTRRRSAERELFIS